MKFWWNLVGRLFLKSVAKMLIFYVENDVEKFWENLWLNYTYMDFQICQEHVKMSFVQWEGNSQSLATKFWKKFWAAYENMETGNYSWILGKKWYFFSKIDILRSPGNLTDPRFDFSGISYDFSKLGENLS